MLGGPAGDTGRRSVRPTSQRHLDLGAGTLGLDEGPASPRAPNSVIRIWLRVLAMGSHHHFMLSFKIHSFGVFFFFFAYINLLSDCFPKTLSEP